MPASSFLSDILIFVLFFDISFYFMIDLYLFIMAEGDIYAFAWRGFFYIIREEARREENISLFTARWLLLTFDCTKYERNTR
jgi:hypothetical protein